MKHTAAVLLAVLLTLSLCASAGAEKIITLSFAGDCTLGCGEDDKHYIKENFDAIIAEAGYKYCFANFYDLFSQDDCTVVNCEGVFQNTKDGEKKIQVLPVPWDGGFRKHLQGRLDRSGFPLQ